MSVDWVGQDTCRDPAITSAYAKDPLCTQKGTFKGVADMLLGVSYPHSYLTQLTATAPQLTPPSH